jgi:hypothetical protein
MNFKIFDDKIVVPTKCGTRYCESIFPTYELVWSNHWYIDDSILNKNYWIVYRNPMEHLISALQTEMAMVVNGHEKSTLNDVIDRFCREEGTGHWCKDVCKDLHTLWYNNQSCVNLIELNDLSNTLQSIGYTPIEYNKKEYDFDYLHNKWNKDDYINYIKKNRPKEWKWLEWCASKDMVYYERLNKRLPPPPKFI